MYETKKHLVSVLCAILIFNFGLNGCGQGTANTTSVINEEIPSDTEPHKSTADDQTIDAAATTANTEIEDEPMNHETIEVTPSTEDSDNTQTPFSLHGALHVEGTALKDSH